MPSGLFDRKIAIRKIAFSCALWHTRPTSPPAGGESPEPQRNPVCTLSLICISAAGPAPRPRARATALLLGAAGMRTLPVNQEALAAAEHALAVSSCY